jgi:hypothetical protein
MKIGLRVSKTGVKKKELDSADARSIIAHLVEGVCLRVNPQHDSVLMDFQN